MEKIKTPSGLEQYVPYGRTILEFSNIHKNIVLLESIFIKNQQLNAGDWFRTKRGDCVKCIGFDEYLLPIEINEQDKPINVCIKNGFKIEIFENKTQKVKRVIYACSSGYCFEPIFAEDNE